MKTREQIQQIALERYPRKADFFKEHREQIKRDAFIEGYLMCQEQDNCVSYNKSDLIAIVNRYRGTAINEEMFAKQIIDFLIHQQMKLDNDPDQKPKQDNVVQTESAMNMGRTLSLTNDEPPKTKQ